MLAMLLVVYILILLYSREIKGQFRWHEVVKSLPGFPGRLLYHFVLKWMILSLSCSIPSALLPRRLGLYSSCNALRQCLCPLDGMFGVLLELFYMLQWDLVTLEIRQRYIVGYPRYHGEYCL